MRYSPRSRRKIEAIIGGKINRSWISTRRSFKVVVFLPRDPVERLRWIALLCVAMSNIEGFPCGNLVLPVGFLPEDMMEIYEEVYSPDVIEEVEKIRKQMAERVGSQFFQTGRLVAGVNPAFLYLKINV